jgi:hypothetical protein
MGHIRLGRLPKTKPWVRVVQALGAEEPDANFIASQTARAAARHFTQLKGDPMLAECLWTLARIGTAAKGTSFERDILHFGFDTARSTTGLGFVSEAARVVTRECPRPSLFGEMALAAFKDVLAARLVDQSSSLFGATLDDVRLATATIGTDNGFASAVRDFYGTFMSRALRFLTDKELSNRIQLPPSGRLAVRDKAIAVNADLDRFCRESAKIVEIFASGWFSKQNWKSNKQISKKAAAGFSAHAVEKLRMEIAGAAE